MSHKPQLKFTKSLKRRQFLQLAGLTTLSSKLLSGCGWTLAEVRSQTAPRKPSNSQELFIYTWANYTDQDLLNRFYKETGFKAVTNVFPSNEVMLARLQASGGGDYSIIYPSDYMVEKMKSMGMLSQLEFSRIRGLEHLMPRFLNPEYDPGNLHSVPISWGTTGLIYNSQKLQTAPLDWTYLWENQKQLTRRMTLLEDVREVMGAVLKMMGYSYNSRNPDEINKAYQKLMELKPSIASFTTDTWRDQVLSGDILIAMCYSSDANEVIEEKKHLNYIIPKSGSTLWMDTLAIPKTAPNPEAAYAWINFMLQPDVSAQMCERLSFATPNQLAFNLLPKEVKENPRLFPPESDLDRCESLAPVGDLAEVYDKYWTKLTSA